MIPGLVTTPGVATASSQALITAGSRSVLTLRCTATIPATWGVAIDVPLMVYKKKKKKKREKRR